MRTTIYHDNISWQYITIIREHQEWRLHYRVTRISLFYIKWSYHTFIHLYVYTYIYSYMCIHIYTYMCIQIYTYMYIHKYILICVYIYIPICVTAALPLIQPARRADDVSWLLAHSTRKPPAKASPIRFRVRVRG
jgi:hypothetical protein